MGENTFYPALPELGFYGLAGHSATPRDALRRLGAAARHLDAGAGRPRRHRTAQLTTRWLGAIRDLDSLDLVD